MSSRVAARYSKSLLDLAVKQKCDEKVYGEMNDLLSTVKESADLKALLNNPIISSTDKRLVLGSIFKDYSDSTRKFIDLVVDRKREGELAEMAQSYVSKYDEIHSLAKATVRSAIPLTSDAMDKVKKYLQGAIQVDQIQLENIIDASVIGGMVIRYEDRLLDLSVSKELKEIRKQLIYN